MYNVELQLSHLLQASVEVKDVKIGWRDISVS